MGNFDRVFVIGVQLKRHNFERWESFRGLVDIPRIYHLYNVYASYWWRGTYGFCPRKKFRRSVPSTTLSDVFALDDSMSLRRGQDALFNSSLYSVSPHIYCNLSSFSTQSPSAVFRGHWSMPLFLPEHKKIFKWPIYQKLEEIFSDGRGTACGPDRSPATRPVLKFDAFTVNVSFCFPV